MMLTSLLPDISIVAITVFLIWKFEPSVPFREAMVAVKDIARVQAQGKNSGPASKTRYFVKCPFS
jgi:hypothetical protein